MNEYDTMDDTATKPEIKRIKQTDSDYPSHLRAVLEGKARKPLYLQGNIDLLKADTIGFCGSRKSSPEGLDFVKNCAKQAVKSGLTVVSGNAAGVDFKAHYHALEAGGSTILVLPEGISHFRIKRALKPVWDWDWERVLVVSQFEMDDVWTSYRAMERNQVIIGLSKAIVVVEAGEKGGTMDAGKRTLKLGIPLYVAKYDDISSDALGNEKLIQLRAKELRQSEGRVNMESVFADIAKERTPPAEQMRLFR